MKIHTCFPQCRTNADCYLGFNVDKRDKCGVAGVPVTEEGILCVSDTTPCETLVTSDEMCLNEANTFCISWRNIWISVLILNCL